VSISWNMPSTPADECCGEHKKSMTIANLPCHASTHPLDLPAGDGRRSRDRESSSACLCQFLCTLQHVRVHFAQLLQQHRKLFWAKLCQSVSQNSFTEEATERRALWSGLAEVKLQKGSFPRFALPFAKPAPGWGPGRRPPARRR
jgi:hypothetical protein